jgi:hypothetical protein
LSLQVTRIALCDKATALSWSGASGGVIASATFE